MSVPRLTLRADPGLNTARADRRPALCLLAAPIAGGAAVLALAAADDLRASNAVCAVLVLAWAASGVLVGIRRRSDHLGPIVLGGALIGAGTMLADAHGDRALARLLLGIAPAVGFHLLAALPNGRVGRTARGYVILAAYVAGAFVGVLMPHDSSGPELWPLAMLWAVAVSAGLAASHHRYRSADATDRRRMQWIGWSVAVVAEFVLAVVALRVMVDWPGEPADVVLASTVLVPAALAAGTHDRLIARVDRLLTTTISLAGLTALVIIAYIAVVVLYGQDISVDERTLLLLSMAAALVAASVFLPLRAKLGDIANQLVYGERVAPDDALRTWGSRLTRAIPLEELLLQLTESLRKSMALASAEIFTGSDGVYELAAGVPHRSRVTLAIGAKECQVVSRSGVSGGTWLDVWIPHLAPTNSANTRVAPIVHAGSLLGLIVLTRDEAKGPASEEDDRVLSELARQVGLALHNVQLDSALQASLDALQETNAELLESRRRIVSAGDAERRKLERNLHDGAQQHLVAMAVKLRMAEELIEDDPVEAAKVVEELRNSLKEAIVELRALAHGIFPPLLSSGGLREALPAAASRSSLEATVDTSGTGRYSPEIESTVYFCCLEALQNAAKHAGADAEVTIRVHDDGELLMFEISDDGVGFADTSAGTAGHGFVNMIDRVGTVRGVLQVTSSPGHGTTIRGEIPLVESSGRSSG